MCAQKRDQGETAPPSACVSLFSQTWSCTRFYVSFPAQRFRLTATQRRHQPSESRHRLPVDSGRLAALIPPL